MCGPDLSSPSKPVREWPSAGNKPKSVPLSPELYVVWFCDKSDVLFHVLLNKDEIDYHSILEY